MRRKYTILIGKTVKKVTAMRGGGTALPGLVMEKLDKRFVPQTLSTLPRGVVVITGTNGKTTTTKMVSEMLTNAGLSVFTNRTGSNFVRGVAAALLHEIGPDGRLPHDIAVLELDEAHAVHFVKNNPIKHVLILNVMRDQLDRFGEIDHTARLLQKVASRATESVVLNRDDARVAKIAETLDKKLAVRYFGASPQLQRTFVSDDQLHQLDQLDTVELKPLLRGDIELASFGESGATFKSNGKTYEVKMQLSGAYNYLNAAGAITLCKLILKDEVPESELIGSLSNVKPAFGRGETVTVNGQPLELVLVKNPAGFRLALASFDPKDTPVMIAINDNYADGRDMSWLWDVDFSMLKDGGVHTVTGVRAYDMALRLQYDDVQVKKVETDLKAALDGFVSDNKSPGTKLRIFCTYTSMLTIRRLLKKYTHMEQM